MYSQDQVVSFMDLLDLDEEIIDNRLKCIMKKEKHTTKQLSNAIHLLQYKQLINLKDGCDCENEEELEFAARLIKETNVENINAVCQILAITLGLNSSTLINKSEHLLQQILADLYIPVHSREDPDTPEQNTALWNFKIADSILDTVIKKGEKINLPFLELPLKSILHSSDEKLKIHFLTSTVSKIFEGVSGYSILDNIWEHVKALQDNRAVFLNVLSALSEYFLPVADSTGKLCFQSEIVFQYEFWDNVYHGLLSTDQSIRKISMYLAKRALDCVIPLSKNICVKSNNDTIFTWNHNNMKNEKVRWDNFFILIDSLEEKQSNIVLPSLQLFGSLKPLGNWLNCAFNIGLKHDNTQVRLKCIQHRLDTNLKSQAEATILLEALNDINIYDNQLECEDLKKKLTKFISDTEIFVHVFIAIPDVKWSPVPFYHITSILSEIKFKDLISITNLQITKSIIDILKIPCNHVTLRKAVFVNITDFIANNCSGMHWKDILSLFCILQSEIVPDEGLKNPLNLLISKSHVKDTEKTTFFEVILDTHSHIEYGLLYLQHYPSDLPIFIDMISLFLNKIEDIVNRQYSDKSEHLHDLIYVVQLYMKTKLRNSSVEAINFTIAREFQTIVHYILSLLSNNTLLTIDEMNILVKGFASMCNSIDTPDFKEILLQLYKTAVLFIKDKETVLETKVLSMFLISCLTINKLLIENYKYEMLSLKEIITLTANFENKQSVGRLRNLFYEKSCEIVETLMKCDELNTERHIKDVAEFVDNVIECGGYGCLRHCLQIMNTILPFLLENDSVNYNIIQFINRMWKEIEELKSSNQYNPCIEEFVNLITHNVLLKRSMYNNAVILYCNKIVEYGTVKTGPLYHLVKKLYTKDINSDNGQLIYVLCEILLYAPVPRKDQRIVENLVVRILQDPKYDCSKKNVVINFNFQVQYLTLLILTKINNADILSNIEMFIRSRMNEVFKNKQRYHGHSQAHRLLLTALQHLLLISALTPDHNESMVAWCIALLGRLPHQPSVRICLEWYIAFSIYLQKKVINQDLLKMIDQVPVASQFMILFWIIKHKLPKSMCSNEEYDFVMDVLLSHTMGQMFNIRLNAQYLATKLYEIHKNAPSKYTYTINVIEKTFLESAKDKNFIKLQQDYFVNSFDIVNDFTPAFIYYFLPRYCEINNNEYIDLPFVRDIVKQINGNVKSHDFFKTEGLIQKSDEELFAFKDWKGEKSKVVDVIEESGTIQKKYIPWMNMNDVTVYESGKKKRSHSELVVVASLIDKLPNLGGMARTSEVFGVKTYVVDSLRHLQDKQFQGLSVSAERWIDVEEVRPGPPLKQYLLQKKAEGYAVVAAEQTSTSAKLQTFKFPKKTLLLLGHEKEGIPCDLLPMMDYCVEIPQQGFVRSLNVHVTAAIFVWEYARQNVL